MGKKIKAILFDSGKVLNGPSMGHWFIPPEFFSSIDAQKFKAISNKRKKAAFYKAGQYMKEQKLIATEAEEYSHFLAFYQIFFEQLPELSVSQHIVETVTKDLVYNHNKYRFYADAIAVLPALSKKYKLAVVSDAWPSLERVFVHAGMRNYFSSFVISSVKGICKPDQKMYQTALEELNIMADEAVFIDDSLMNCNGAARLGIKTFLLCRDIKAYIYFKLMCKNHNVIYSLKRLDQLISSLDA